MGDGRSGWTKLDLKRAQQRTLSIRSIEARVYHTRHNFRCRLCKDAPQTMQHITSKISVQKSPGTVLGTARVLRRTQAPRPLVKDLSLKGKYFL